jgi:molybdate transport system substrate-binding protein
MKKSNLFVAFNGMVLLFGAVLLAAVPTSRSRATGVVAERVLTVFAAASLQDAFTEIAAGFEATRPGLKVVFNFASSATLATQLVEGAPADVFASANERQMTVVQAAGRLAGVPRPFARNRLILIVPRDNPAQISGLRDLARPGVKLIVAAKVVPVREYTEMMLDRFAALPDYGPGYRAAVLSNVVSEEANVRQVSAKVALGEADAGIVYQSDVTPDLAPQVIAFPIPDALNTIATYPIVALTEATDPTLAEAFITYVLSEPGQAVLARWEFVIETKAMPDADHSWCER